MTTPPHGYGPPHDGPPYDGQPNVDLPHGWQPPGGQWQPGGYYYPAPGHYPGAGWGGGPPGFGQHPSGQHPAPPPPPTYLWQSVVLLVISSCACFLLLPFPILAIVSASKIDELARTGNYESALAASRSARAWCITSAATIVIPIVTILLLAVTGAFDK